MLPYFFWHPLYGPESISIHTRLSTRIERGLRTRCARADERLRAVALSTMRLALFRI